MNSKGFIRFVAILLAIASLWQLSFTVATKLVEKDADEYAQKAFSQFETTDAYKNMKEDLRGFCRDSVLTKSTKSYLDSMSSQKVYLGYTYKDVKAKEINLGLDLKGGMNVMLQIQLKDLVKALAVPSLTNGNKDFNDAMALAESRSKDNSANFIDLFSEAWKETTEANHGQAQPLAPLFCTDMMGEITVQSKDEDVVAALKDKAKSTVASSFKVLRSRIDRFGVTQPNIQQIGESGRILVELPGVKEPDRVRKLLQGTAALEFWTCYDNADVFSYLSKANKELAAAKKAEKAAADTIAAKPAAAAAAKPAADTASSAVSSILAQEESKAAKDAADDAAQELRIREENPLFSLLQPNVNPKTGAPGEGSCIGYALSADTAAVNAILRTIELPEGLIPMWSVKPGENSDYYELVAINDAEGNGKAPLTGAVVTDARVQYDGQGGSSRPEVSMTMNADGANTWARMTKENIGKQIAIVLDGMVYSYPRVNSEIPGGSSQITGNFTMEEAEDLANVLKAGTLPAPATIVQEQVVGPSLGIESINAGMISFALAFVLVLIYMICFYKGAGLVADVALLCNVLLLFGLLTSFGAVLTLPGIAGLVLTMGMAVDANVIIYERIKEELLAGKGLSKAIDDGFSNAYSAIVDGQVTTLLTGIVLYIFGNGPVQGFATTLVLGIITSVLTAIFIPRLIFSDRVATGKSISFETKFTHGFLKNTHFDFIGKRKISYIASGTVIVLCLVSMFTKGFTYGVDFTGGRTYVLRFDQPVNDNDVRIAVTDAFKKAADADPNVKASTPEVKQFGGESQVKVTTAYKNDITTEEVNEEIKHILYGSVKGFYKENIEYPEFINTTTNPNGIVSSDAVGPTIANDIKRGAVIAVIIALFVIFAYIAIRFKKWTWGLGGVVSLAHTAIIVIGFFSIFSEILPFSLDVDQTFIAAILTIIGYAINDNVVIFDRIREYRKDHPKAELKENANLAVNATLSRTVNTSLTTLVTMLAIAIFGGEVIRGLAVALITGIIIGTYASIFIGTPVMYDAEMLLQKRREKKAMK